MNRLTLKIVAAAFALVWHSIAPVPAQAQGCMPGPFVLESAKAVGLTQAVTLDAQQVAIVTKWWNDQEPKSDDKFSEGYLLRGEGNTFGMALGNGGLLCAYGSLSPEQAKEIDGLLAGTAGPGA